VTFSELYSGSSASCWFESVLGFESVDRFEMTRHFEKCYLLRATSKLIQNKSLDSKQIPQAKIVYYEIVSLSFSNLFVMNACIDQRH
jgi:hypothetical protein